MTRASVPLMPEELREQLDLVSSERDELRRVLSGQADQHEREDAKGSERTSGFWFAAWKDRNRQRAELLLQNARLEAAVKHHAQRAAFYKSCALAGEVPSEETIARMDTPP